MGQFSLDISRFVEKAKEDANLVCRKIAIDLLSRIVDRSPVGNPELWAANRVAFQYNSEVADYNAAQRSNPANLTKNGRLKRGKLLKDGMDLVAGKGYVGGRFRGNWQIQVGTAPAGQLPRIDPTGEVAKTSASGVLAEFRAGPPIFIQNNLPYGPRLEFESWSKQAPAGMVRITIAEFDTIVQEAVAGLPT